MYARRRSVGAPPGHTEQVTVRRTHVEPDAFGADGPLMPAATGAMFAFVRSLHSRRVGNRRDAFADGAIIMCRAPLRRDRMRTVEGVDASREDGDDGRGLLSLHDALPR